MDNKNKLDPKFEQWMEDFDKSWKGSKANDIMVGRGYSQSTYQLLTWYMQFQDGKQTKSLVKATWILAVFTIILSIATIWMALKG